MNTITIQDLSKHFQDVKFIYGVSTKIIQVIRVELNKDQVLKMSELCKGKIVIASNGLNVRFLVESK